MKKPLMRWVIGGDCCKDAFDVLEHAVKKAEVLYPEVDKVIVYNNLPTHRIDKIKTFGVKLVDADNYKCPWNFEKAEWLLWPPRLRKDSWEICMDNDIVLLKRIPLVDFFLKQADLFVASESYFRRHYGSYDDVVPRNRRGINCGLYCMPPGFDFLAWLRNFYEKYGRREYDHVNPQGVVAAMIMEQKRKRIIPKERLPISQIMREMHMEEEMDNVLGLHFSGVNRGKSGDTWAIYKSLAMRNNTWL